MSRIREALPEYALHHPLNALNLVRAYLGKTPTRVLATLPGGKQMEVYPPDSVSTRILIGIPYEQDVTSFFEHTIKPGNTVFDIGAHIGYHTVELLNKVGQQGHIVAFEPTPFTFNVLRKNTSCFKNITAVQKAVSDGNQPEVTLLDYGKKLLVRNTIMSNPRVDRLESQETAKTINVKAISVDQYVDMNPELTPDFIKIDAEGAEYLILKGADKTIENSHPSITFETDHPDSHDWAKTENCFDFLRIRGYFIFFYDSKNQQIKPVQFQDKFEGTNIQGTNILCIHHSKLIENPLFSA